jgi:hypothetical protein
VVRPPTSSQSYSRKSMQRRTVIPRCSKCVSSRRKPGPTRGSERRVGPGFRRDDKGEAHSTSNTAAAPSRRRCTSSPHTASRRGARPRSAHARSGAGR